MRTSKEWAEILSWQVADFESAVKEIQSEAIDETVKACAEAAEVEWAIPSSGHYDNIDKFCVDKESILSVAEQLKAKP